MPDEENKKNSNEAVINRMKAEGQLLRNTGTNSVKSIKEILVKKMDGMTDVLTSISSSMLKQVSSLDKMTDINKAILAEGKERKEDEAREEAFRPQQEADDLGAAEIARGNVMADIMSTMMTKMKGVLGNMFTTMPGKIIKAVVMAAGVAVLGIPFIAGFLESAFGFDLKEEAGILLDKVTLAISDFASFAEMLKAMVPSMNTVMIGIGLLISSITGLTGLVTRLTASAATGLAQGLRGGGRGKPATAPPSSPIIPDSVDSKNNKPKRNAFQRQMDAIKRLIAKHPKKAAGATAFLTNPYVWAATAIGAGLYVGAPVIGEIGQANHEAGVDQAQAFFDEAVKLREAGDLEGAEELFSRANIDAERQTRIVYGSGQDDAGAGGRDRILMDESKAAVMEIRELIRQRDMNAGEAAKISSYLEGIEPATILPRTQAPNTGIDALKDFIAKPPEVVVINNNSAPVVNNNTSNVVAGGGGTQLLRSTTIFDFTSGFLLGGNSSVMN